jgi:hypothetical protein
MIKTDDIARRIAANEVFKHFPTFNDFGLAVNAVGLDQNLLNEVRFEIIKASNEWFTLYRDQKLTWTGAEHARHCFLFELFSRAEDELHKAFTTIMTIEQENHASGGRVSQLTVPLPVAVTVGLNAFHDFDLSIKEYVAFLVAKGVYSPSAEQIPEKVDAEFKRLTAVITAMKDEAAPYMAAIRNGATVSHFEKEADRLYREQRMWLSALLVSMVVAAVVALTSMWMTASVDLKWLAIRVPFAATLVLLEWLLVSQYLQAKQLWRDYRAKTVVAEELAAVDALSPTQGALAVERLRLLHGVTANITVSEPLKDALRGVEIARDVLKEIPKN